MTFKDRRSKVDVLHVMRHLAAVVAFASLVLAGCGGTTSRTGAGGAEIVPADATMYLAINTDADAPLFRVASYGVVGDASEIVPLLIEEIKQRANR